MKSVSHSMAGVRGRAWYMAPTVLNGVVSIASVPLLILFIGSAGWAEIALGQAMGLFGSVFIGLGWPVVGPALLARSSVDEQYEHYVLSVWARITFAVLVTGVTIILFVYLAPDRSVLLWATVASNLLGCASSWYFLGIDDPRGLFWRDALVRSLGTSLGLVGVAITSRGELFAIGMLLGIVGSMIFTYEKVRKRRHVQPPRPTLGKVLRSIQSQGNGLTANALYVALSSLALPLTAVVGGQVFIVFAILDKVQKQLTTVALPLTQLITGRMAGDLGRGADSVDTANRTFRSILLSGTALCLLMIPIGPLAVNVMSVGTVSVDVWQTILLAIMVGLAFVTQCIPIAVLAPIGKLRYALFGMSLAIILGIPAVLWCAREGAISSLLIVLCVIYVLSIFPGVIGLYLAKVQKAADALL